MSEGLEIALGTAQRRVTGRDPLESQADQIAETLLDDAGSQDLVAHHAARADFAAAGLELRLDEKYERTLDDPDGAKATAPPWSAK